MLLKDLEQEFPETRIRMVIPPRDVVENEPGQLSAWARFHWARALNEKVELVEARRVAMVGANSSRNRAAASAAKTSLPRLRPRAST